jgi:hypothetical protein
LALEYLLASEGGICGKFNLNNWCLQIDDLKSHKKITHRIKKLTRVPIQTWERWTLYDLLGGWFSTLDGFKTLIGEIGLILVVWLIYSAWFPLVLQTFRTVMEANIERKTATNVMMLWNTNF